MLLLRVLRRESLALREDGNVGEASFLCERFIEAGSKEGTVDV